MYSDVLEVFSGTQHILVVLFLADTCDRCGNSNLLAVYLFLLSLGIAIVFDFLLIHDFVIDTVTILSQDSVPIFISLEVNEATLSSGNSVGPSLFLVLRGSANAEFFFSLQGSINFFHVRFTFYLELCQFSYSLVSIFAKSLLDIVLTHVRVANQLDGGRRRSQSFPVQLLNCLHSLEVILSESRILLGNNLDTVDKLLVMSRS